MIPVLAHRALAQLGTELDLKLRLSVVLTLLFCIPYFTLQRLPIFPPLRFAPSRLDEAIPFTPAWVWVYQSVYLLLAIVPWLSGSREVLARYTRGFLLLAGIGFLFFVLLPIEAPRPAEVPRTGMFGLLVWYDGTVNTFPSLHVGLAAYTALLAAQISRGLPAAARLTAIWGTGLWTAAIAYAAIATKQHFVVDLPAGVLLAWICHRQVWIRA